MCQGIRQTPLAFCNDCSNDEHRRFAFNHLFVTTEPRPSAGAVPAASDASKEPSAPTKFTLSLTHPGEKKVSAVKALRSIFSDIGQTLDLVSAKAKLDNLPYNVLEGISKEDADKHAETLKKAGCQYEIKAE